MRSFFLILCRYAIIPFRYALRRGIPRFTWGAARLWRAVERSASDGAANRVYAARQQVHNGRKTYVETKVEALKDNQVKLTVTIDAKEIDDRIKKTYKDFASK